MERITWEPGVEIVTSLCPHPIGQKKSRGPALLQGSLGNVVVLCDPGGHRGWPNGMLWPVDLGWGRDGVASAPSAHSMWP